MKTIEFHAEAPSVGLLLFRPRGDVEFSNGRAQALFGCKDHAELEQRLSEIRPQLEPLLGRGDLDAAKRGSIGVEIAVDDRPRALHLDWWAIGKPACETLLALVTDVAAQRESETNLRLATYLRGLSRVHVATAHDVRGPLNAMVLHLDLLGGTVDVDSDSDLREQCRRHVSVIGEELRRLHRMIETLFTQIGVTDTAVGVFDLRGVIQELEVLLGPHWRRNKVRARVTLPDAPVTIEGNREALKQTIFNVLIASSDALPGDSDLDVMLAAGDSAASLVIAGSAPGIAPELTDGPSRVNTLHESATGLQGARSVVDAHGGRIRVQSEPNLGTRLEIELPLSPPGS